jgi:hypothetical protein
LPGAIRSGTMPSLSHHTASALSPSTPLPANGAPLSERIARGRPYSLNTRSIATRTAAPVGRASASQHSR